MTNEYELADDNRESLIWTKEQLVAPLQPGMEPPPHPMRLGATERDYYLLGRAGGPPGPTRPAEPARDGEPAGDGEPAEDAGAAESADAWVPGAGQPAGPQGGDG